MTFDLDEVQLGPAVPEQATAAAALILDTDPSLWSYLLADDALPFFEAEWRAEDSVFGHSFATAATLDGELLGIEQGLDRLQHDKYQAGIGQHGGGCLRPDTLEAMGRRADYLAYLFTPIPKGIYYVQFLSVATQVRGRGLGERLLSNAFRHAELAGYKACQLDVAGDSRAVEFYLHMGMEILAESRVVPLEEHGVSSHYRMVKAL